MSDINFGKHVLESLSIGMYSDPMTIYREYIQNSTDEIDKAVKNGLLTSEEGTIHVVVNSSKRLIIIEDNGPGIKESLVYNTLLDVGKSGKDFRENRGFRGIGRLGGLGLSNKLSFVTSYAGEAKKSIVEWDGDKLLNLLNVDNKEVETAVEVIEQSTKFYQDNEDNDKHYFKVILKGVYPQFSELLDENRVEYYLSVVAPVAFDAQKFIHAKTINPEYKQCGKPIETYNVYLNNRKKPIYKQYRTAFKTGHQERTKKVDQIQQIEFFEGNKDDGTLLYKGWYGITNFYGSVSDKSICGIRIRKGNILIGGEDTFSRFFSSEGDNANKWFIGEVHVYDTHLLPNAKRDDFERNEAYELLKKLLSKQADLMNREHRRAMSNFHSKIKSITMNLNKLDAISSQISSGQVASEVKREKLIQDKKEIEKKLVTDQKELARLAERETLDEKYRKQAQALLKRNESAKKEIVQLETKLINIPTATKSDLDSSYSRAERKIYDRIIESIYAYFSSNIEIADKLKEKILSDLKVKKKA
ncbi:Chaperone protein HtpG [Pelotomaculum sp. FP]|uniref:ATP-binding protein n=1 Tax=Pelotomaculum sp. FP TaxID=261474 RepID=UPI001065AAE2|nr:ATP-binding protein [Pelotomaculum sp. FP]TEB16262.1 Chaperone protein HtpG [Pelotomaculum sp. FP]